MWLRLRARVGPFMVSAVVEPPVPAELRARWVSRQRFGDLRPADAAVPRHVPGRDRIRDPLKAQRLDQPVKQRRGVVVSDGANDATIAQVAARMSSRYDADPARQHVA